MSPGSLMWDEPLNSSPRTNFTIDVNELEWKQKFGKKRICRIDGEKAAGPSQRLQAGGRPRSAIVEVRAPPAGRPLPSVA